MDRTIEQELRLQLAEARSQLEQKDIELAGLVVDKAHLEQDKEQLTAKVAEMGALMDRALPLLGMRRDWTGSFGQAVRALELQQQLEKELEPFRAEALKKHLAEERARAQRAGQRSHDMSLGRWDSKVDPDPTRGVQQLLNERLERRGEGGARVDGTDDRREENLGRLAGADLKLDTEQK